MWQPLNEPVCAFSFFFFISKTNLSFPGHLQEDFDQPMMLCPVDLHKLQALVGFDVKERYKSLLDFHRAHDFAEEAAWTERRLKFLQPKQCELTTENS